jgi:Uma2 family endonuclease
MSTITPQKEVRDIVALLMKRPITEEIALKVAAIEGYEHLEIKDGEWVGFDVEGDEMTTGEEHGWIESLLLILTGTHVLANKLGRVYPGDVTFVMEGTSDNIRRKCEPDVAFVASQHVTPTAGFIYRAPDLAIEIISPSQKFNELKDKVDEYLRYGTRQVWLVRPPQKEIIVFLPDGTSKDYRIGQTILGGDLLPGFKLDVAAVFAE